MRLRSSAGELVRGRCGSPNLCAYCARLGAVENAELLALDALAGSAPSLWAVLTTADAEPDPARFYRSRAAVIRALRRRWPDCQYAALVEFTTGYGPRAAGARRPHWNLLLKGVPVECEDEAAEVIRDVWCGREHAEPWAQFVGPVSEVGGLMRYLALHFQKESQAPPIGWKGHRFLKSRGYLAGSTPAARVEARKSLRHKRELWKAIRRGLGALDAELAAHEAMALAESLTWEVVALPPAARVAPLPSSSLSGTPAEVELAGGVGRTPGWVVSSRPDPGAPDVRDHSPNAVESVHDSDQGDLNLSGREVRELLDGGRERGPRVAPVVGVPCALQLAEV